MGRTHRTAEFSRSGAEYLLHPTWGDGDPPCPAVRGIIFRLYNRYGGTPSFLTAQAILNEIYKSYQDNKPVNFKKCLNH